MFIRTLYNRLQSSWHRFWFEPASLRALAAYRILVFGYLLGEILLVRTSTHLPLGRLQYPFIPGNWEPILLAKILGFAPPVEPWFSMAYGGMVVCVLAALFGLKTNWTAGTASLLYFYFIAVGWSYGQNQGTMTGLNWALLALTFSPCGKRYSIDAWRHGRWISAEEKRPSDRSPWARWPVRFVQLTVCWIYFASGFAKLKEGWVHDFPNLANLHVLIVDRGVSVAEVLARTPALVQASQAGSALLEFLFPLILFFPRSRWVLLPGAVLMHLSIWILMPEFGTFFGLWFLFVFFFDLETLVQRLNAKWSRIWTLHRKVQSWAEMFCRKVRIKV